MQEEGMDDTFSKKVRTAAVAGWWTLLIAYCILLLSWLIYVLVMIRQPAGMFCLWGQGVTWPEIRTIWLWAMVVFKLIIGTMIFIVIWLTIWSRQLAKK
jgi:hypothetical protein